MDGIQDLSAVEVTRLISRRELSAREALASHIAAIQERNETINAVVTTDFERATRLALLADESSARREAWGPLHGLPMTHKDTFATAGLRSTLGSLAFEHHVPATDDLQVARLSAAGVIRTGKTNVPEFGAGSHTFNEIFGTTVNPYDPRLSAGGSSGGVAAAVAARIQAFGDGSDMGGSLRIPASFCNVYGLRPSYGVIPLDANPDADSWLARSGPMARTVADLSLFMHATAGPAGQVNPSPLTSSDFMTPRPSLEGVRIGYSFDFGLGIPVEPAVRDTLLGDLEAFERAGAVLEEATIELSDADEVFRVTRAFDFAAGIGPLLAEHRDVIKTEVLWNVELGLALDAPQLISARAARTRLDQKVQYFFGRYDAFLAPAAQVLPFDASWRWPRSIAGVAATNYLDWMRSACVLSATGLPVVALPGGFTSDGVPVGWQLAANHYQDPALLNWAAAHEQETGHATQIPKLTGVAK